MRKGGRRGGKEGGREGRTGERGTIKHTHFIENVYSRTWYPETRIP